MSSPLDTTTTTTAVLEDDVPLQAALADVDRCFHYVFDVPFPRAATPVAVQTLHGSTCNDICRVTLTTSSADNAEEAKNAANTTPSDVFMKSSRGVRRAEILLEVGALALLRRAGLPVPPVLLAGEVEGTAYLVEPFIHSGRGVVPNWHTVRDEAAAGRALAALHRHRSTDGRFGCRRVAASLNTGDVTAPPAFREVFNIRSEEAVASLTASAADVAADAYVNTFVWNASWPELYLTHLLQPQVTRAQQRGLWSADRQRLFEIFAERFRAHFATRAALAAESDASLASSSSLDDPPCVLGACAESDDATAAVQREVSVPPSTSITECSLLHGDMWGGNLLFNTSGRPVFIDPQPLYGDREMDIAMTQFFGGFGPDFYAAYEADYPLDEEADMRVPWYQLYYALMHLTLLGEAYGRAVEEALRSV